MNKKYTLAFLLIVFIAIAGCKKEQANMQASKAAAAKNKQINLVPVKGTTLPQPTPGTPIMNIAFAGDGTVYGIRGVYTKATVFKYAKGVFTTLFTLPASTTDGASHDTHSLASRLVVDSKNNVYFAYNRDKLIAGVTDAGSFTRIMQITPSGAIAVFAEAPNITPTDRARSYLNDLTIGSDDIIYASDTNINRIWKITPQGEMFKFTQFAAHALSAAVDKSNNLYIAGEFEDLQGNTESAVYKVSPNGVKKTLVETGIAVYIPLVVDKYDNVWFGGRNINWYINVYNKQGESIGSANTGENCLSLAFDRQGKLYYIGKTEIIQCVFK